MSPRRVLPLVVVVVAALTERATADERDDVEAARAVGTIVITALATGEAAPLASAMRAPLDGDIQIPLSAACKKMKFKWATHVSRAKLAPYSRCLVSLNIDLRGRTLDVIPAGKALVVAANNDDLNLRLKLVRVKGEWKVTELGVQDLSEEGGMDGVVGGQVGGVVGGVLGGVSTAPPPPPPPPPSSLPKVVPVTVLENLRIAGTKDIAPDSITVDEIRAADKDKVTAAVKVCILASGAISTVKVLKSSAFVAYDQKLVREINRWKYKPFVVNGTPTPVCSVVMFIFKLTP